MKRSQINTVLQSAQEMFDQYQFKLPPWGYWSPGEWKGLGSENHEIGSNQLGWDITDFGSGDFAKRGLCLFTLRNGVMGKPGRTYAEKIMMVGIGQETPLHFHFHKTEDIINRGGGNLVLQLWNSEADQSQAQTPVMVGIDGIIKTLQPGAQLSLSPGQSICLPFGMYHRFWAEGQPVMVGEVSQVNDDHVDNRFFEALGRFPNIEEDQAPWRLLMSDYPAWM